MLALVLDLLLLDETNPRSLAYQLASISQHLADLPQAQAGRQPHRRAAAHPVDADVDPPRRRRSASPRTARASELQTAVRNQLRLLPQLTTAIERHYFNLLEEQPHRVHTRIEPKP